MRLADLIKKSNLNFIDDFEAKYTSCKTVVTNFISDNDSKNAGRCAGQMRYFIDSNTEKGFKLAVDMIITDLSSNDLHDTNKNLTNFVLAKRLIFHSEKGVEFVNRGSIKLSYVEFDMKDQYFYEDVYAYNRYVVINDLLLIRLFIDVDSGAGPLNTLKSILLQINLNSRINPKDKQVLKRNLVASCYFKSLLNSGEITEIRKDNDFLAEIYNTTQLEELGKKLLMNNYSEAMSESRI